MRTDNATGRRRRGFTLIELGIVVLIIGLIVAFIAVVGFAGVEQARVRATQALITKLEVGLNDRLDALLSIDVKPNGSHRWLAAVNPPAYPFPQPATSPLPWGLLSDRRAAVIARLDQIRMELPDVFFLQADATSVGGGSGPGQYPVNFAGLPFPPPNASSFPGRPIHSGAQTPFAYVLPLGNRAGPGFTPSANPPTPPATAGQPWYPVTDLNPDGQPPINDTNANTGPGAFVGIAPGSYGTPGAPDQATFGGVADQGIYGASFAARAALHSMIGYNQLGTDGVDNNANGLTDEYAEGILNPQTLATDPNAVAKINRFLTNHQHKTARSEMLYAILVEGTGPLGNSFSAGDFKDSEVKDTDDDGLPEFVDAWGEPLQFYRWPIRHPAPNIQRGGAPYGFVSEVREVFPLDPNKQLLDPAWWAASAGGGTGMSLKSTFVQTYFTSLVDPNWPSALSGPPYSDLYDISGAFARRAFACKFLVVSAGPDRETGLYQLDDPTIRSTAGSSPDTVASMLVGDPGDPGNGIAATFGENWAVYVNGYPTTAVVEPPAEALDNIDNQELQSESGGVQ